MDNDNDDDNNNNKNSLELRFKDVQVGDIIVTKDDYLPRDLQIVREKIVDDEGMGLHRLQCTPNIIYPEDIVHLWRRID